MAMALIANCNKFPQGRDSHMMNPPWAPRQAEQLCADRLGLSGGVPKCHLVSCLGLRNFGGVRGWKTHGKHLEKLDKKSLKCEKSWVNNGKKMFSAHEKPWFLWENHQEGVAVPNLC